MPKAILYWAFPTKIPSITPVKIGPKDCPMSIIVESKPSALPRLEDLEISATNADVEAVTVANPKPNRPIKAIKTNQFSVKLKVAVQTPPRIRPETIIGIRPWRSDKCPIKGLVSATTTIWPVKREPMASVEKLVLSVR